MPLDFDKDHANQLVYQYIMNPPETQSELYEFLAALTGETIPFVKCCPDHASPWDYIWMSYRVDLPKWKDKSKPNLVYVGSRAGYKTLSMAKLIAAELLLKPNCRTVGMGAIEKHAMRTFEFVQRYLRHPVVVELEMVKKALVSKTELTNGSCYVQAVATLAGANADHPQKLRIDEVDLMKPSVLEEARMMSQSWADISVHTSYVSSRKKEDGIMDTLVENSFGKDYDVMISCYKDTAEPCPDSRSGTVPKLFEIEDIHHPGMSVVVNAFDGCTYCPILKSCRGDLKRSKGIVRIDDIIKDWNTLSLDTWIWQKECKRTKSSLTFFEYWDEAKQVGQYKYNDNIGWVDMSFDFTGGGEDPTVVGFWQTDEQGNDYLIGEKVYYKKLISDVVSDLKAYVIDNKMKIRHQYGDSAAQTWISELNAADPLFFQIRSTRKITRQDGWQIMKQRVRDNNGVHHLFVDASCEQFIHEMASAKKKYSDPHDIRPKSSDHSLDQARYRFVELYWFGDGGMPNIRYVRNSWEEPKTGEEGSKPLEPPVRQDPWNYIPRYLYGED